MDGILSAIKQLIQTATDFFSGHLKLSRISLNGRKMRSIIFGSCSGFA